jgi:VWFA-related protein
MKFHHPNGFDPVRRLWRGSVLVLCACAAFEASRETAVGATAGTSYQAPHRPRTVHVTVVTEKGMAVPDLLPADFEVKEDGKAREVLKAEPAAEPVSVAMILDDKGSDINEIRAALAGFARRLQDRAELALVTVVPTTMTVFDYTSSLPTMMSGIQRLVWRAGPAGGLLLGAVADAADDLQRREAARPAIVVITFEGDEARSHRPAKAVIAALERSRAALHVVAVGKPGFRRMNRAPTEGVQGDEWVVDDQNRNAVLGDGPKESGGRRHELTAATGLGKALEAVADDLVNQYTVVYAGASDAKSSRKLSVSVKRRGVTVRAPLKIASD